MLSNQILRSIIRSQRLEVWTGAAAYAAYRDALLAQLLDQSQFRKAARLGHGVGEQNRRLTQRHAARDDDLMSSVRVGNILRPFDIGIGIGRSGCGLIGEMNVRGDR